MSAETLKAVEDAVAAHVADETEGGVLVGFIAMAAAVIPTDDDGMTTYLKIHGNPTPFHVQMGLSTFLQAQLHGQVVDRANEK